MLMKKIFGIVLSLMLVFSLVSCSSGSQGDATESTTEENGYVISLHSDNTAVNAGEEVTVKVHIKDIPFTACFDIYVFADEQLEYVTSETAELDLYLASNIDENAGGVVVRGMVASTESIADEDICTITYKVSEDAASGSKINLNLQIPLYQVGFDKSGDDVYEISESIVLENLILEVQ